MRLKTITLLSTFLLFSITLLASPDTVEMVDDVFVPENITITEGDTIVWINTGSNNHTSTSGTDCTADGFFNSGTVEPGQQFTFTFDTIGELPYYCIPHCGIGMEGTVTVESDPIGTEEVLAETTVEIFPNPVKDLLQVQLSSGNISSVAVKIYDINGRKVMQAADIPVSADQFRLDTSPLRQGLYVVEMTIDGQAIMVEKINKL